MSRQSRENQRQFCRSYTSGGSFCVTSLYIFINEVTFFLIASISSCESFVDFASRQGTRHRESFREVNYVPFILVTCDGYRFASVGYIT
jgi:hypothetical protein